MGIFDFGRFDAYDDFYGSAERYYSKYPSDIEQPKEKEQPVKETRTNKSILFTDKAKECVMEKNKNLYEEITDVAYKRVQETIRYTAKSLKKSHCYFENGEVPRGVADRLRKMGFIVKIVPSEQKSGLTGTEVRW